MWQKCKNILEWIFHTETQDEVADFHAIEVGFISFEKPLSASLRGYGKIDTVKRYYLFGKVIHKKVLERK